jgi:hypothetical protein
MRDSDVNVLIEVGFLLYVLINISWLSDRFSQACKYNFGRVLKDKDFLSTNLIVLHVSLNA